MPLVQELQNRLGKDKLAVLLLSLDGEGSSRAEAIAGMEQAMKDEGVDLPCAIVPGGSVETQERFGVQGYGIALIGPDGAIKGRDLQLSDVESMLDSP